MKDKLNARLHWTTTITEKLMLGGIGALTVLAAANEVWGMWLLQNIELEVNSTTEVYQKGKIDF